MVDVRLAAAGAAAAAAAHRARGLGARTAARLRPLGGSIARLTLAEPLPLHVGDRLLLRDPGQPRRPSLTGAGTGAGPVAAGPAAWPPLVGATVLDWPRPRSAAGARPPRRAGSSPPGPSRLPPANLLRRTGCCAPPRCAPWG